jgi:hypothetical protein
MASRPQIYGLLIVVAVSLAASRIVSAQRVYEPAMATDGRKDDWRGSWPDKRPKPAATYSSNDRSRWATVRALVDEGTYVVGTRDCRLVAYSAIAPLAGGNVLEAAILAQAGYLVRTKDNDLFKRPDKTSPKLPDRGIIFENGWESIDRVLKPTPVVGEDGTPLHWEFYSSKPPLLATLMAGLYWLLQQITGWTLANQYVETVRVLLLIIHPLPFALYLWVLGQMAERYGRTDWGRFFVMAAGCFATLLPAFLNTFNNHTLGTFSVLFALYSVTAIWEKRQSAKPQAVGHHYFLAGLFAAFAAANELPALSFACAVGLLLMWRSPVRTLCFFVPPALLIAAGFLWTNYLAVGQLRPAYSEFGGPPPFQRKVLGDLDEKELGSPWYQYEGSHWRKPVVGQSPRHGIDWARYYENRWSYALHLLVGHHGVFSLTPIWLLAFIGMIVGLTGRGTAASVASQPSPASPTALPWFIAPLTLIVSLVVIGFYLVMSENYGGFAIGPRWLIWLTPLWLVCLLPVADWLAASRWGRGLALILLGISTFSAFYSNWNPWRHPWIYDFLEWMGWIGY